MLPLCPLPDVLPVPEPGPRPRRFRFRCEPGAGVRLFNPIRSTAGSARSTRSARDAAFFLVAMLLALASLLRRCHLDEVAHLIDLTAQARRYLLDDDVLVVFESHRAQREAMTLGVPDAAANLLDAHLAGLRQLECRGLFRAARRSEERRVGKEGSV